MKDPKPLSLEQRIKWLEIRLVKLQRRVDVLEGNGARKWRDSFIRAAERLMRRENK